MPLVFSYGTLQQRDVQVKAFGRQLDGSADELHEFELRQNGPHANVVLSGRRDTRVPGTALEISERELAAADRYEAADNYTRMRVVLASGRPAWVYVDAESAFELTTPSTPELWRAFHDVRRKVLFEARGQVGVYDENHPDDRAPDHYPKVLLRGGVLVGVVRIDVDGDTAILRRVAVRVDQQRRGHGRVLLWMAERFAAAQHCRMLTSHVAKDVVGFYEKCGFTVDHPEAESILMAKRVLA